MVCLNKSIYGTKVFITKTASYFPNEPVGNEEMEDGEKRSGAVDRTKKAVLTPCFLATITLKHV